MMSLPRGPTDTATPPVSNAAGAGTREQELRKALAEAERRAELRERQLAELNHRLANTLQIASGLIQAQESRVADPIAKEALNTVVARLEAIAQLHWHLCWHGGARRVDLGRSIGEIAPAIEGATGLRCEFDIEPVEVSGEAALHLSTAVTELALNARKHAYGGRDGGLVRIACRRDPDGRLRLSVADRGRGLPSGFDPCLGTGFGMEIVRATMRQLGGELRADSDQGGARFTLLLSLP